MHPPIPWHSCLLCLLVQTPGQGSFQTPQTGDLRPAFGGVPANLASAFGQSTSVQGQPQQSLPQVQPQAGFGGKLQGNPFGALPQGNPFGGSQGAAGWGAQVTGQGSGTPGNPFDRAQQGQAQPAASAAAGGFGTQSGFGWAEGSLAATSWGAGPSGPTAVGQPPTQGQPGAALSLGQVACCALICACLAVVRPQSCHRLLRACLSATRLWERSAVTKACLAAIGSNNCFASDGACSATAHTVHLHAGASGNPAPTHGSAALSACRARYWRRSSQALTALGWQPPQHSKVLQSQDQSSAQPLPGGASSRAVGASRSMLGRALVTSSRYLAVLAPQPPPGRTASSCLSCRPGSTSSLALALGSSPQPQSPWDQPAWEVHRR